MTYTTEHIIKPLKAAREAKKINQRQLSVQSKIPQSQISKIENGSVDLRLSSLIALARALDLELVLVPRKSVTAVRSVIRQSSLKATPEAPPRPVYSLDKDDIDD